MWVGLSLGFCFYMCNALCTAAARLPHELRATDNRDGSSSRLVLLRYHRVYHCVNRTGLVFCHVAFGDSGLPTYVMKTSSTGFSKEATAYSIFVATRVVAHLQLELSI